MSEIRHVSQIWVSRDILYNEHAGILNPDSNTDGIQNSQIAGISSESTILGLEHPPVRVTPTIFPLS